MARPLVVPRTILQMSMLLFAFLLPFATLTQAAGCAAMALVFVVVTLPRLDVDLRQRPGHAAGESVSTGIVMYPISVLALILLYRHHMHIVAAVWAIMALGDGLACVAAGAWRGPAPPWNRRKTLAGLLGFLLAGTLGAYALTRWVAPDLDPVNVLRVSLATAAVGAAIESLPIRLDDNVTVPLVCGAFMFCAYMMQRSALAANLPYLRNRTILAVAVNLVCALLAWSQKWADRSGAVMGFFLGLVIYLGYGYKSFAIFVAFVLMGSIATRIGYAQKARRGIAERRGGARNWRQALANCLAPAFFAVLAITTLPQAAFRLALLAALAEAAGDTVSSELGEWLSERTYLITTFQRVRPGEDGGVSSAGSLAGFAALALVTALGLALGLCGPRPLLGAALAMAAAVAGNLLDSVLGATLERRGLVTNGVVNFAGTSFAGAVAVVMALRWRLF